MPKDVQINSWEGGMNKDVAPHKMQPNMYFELREGIVVTSEEGNAFGISPVKGNKKGFVLPRIPQTFILNKTGDGSITILYSFQLNDGTIDSAVAAGNTLEDVYLFLLNYPNIVTGINEGSISIRFSSVYNTIYINYFNDNPFNNLQILSGSGVISSVESHVPEIIGGGDFQDDFVIFSEGIDGWGQIWLAIYDETEEDITNKNSDDELILESALKYNGPLNFSNGSPIQRVKSIIESDNYGSIYWTDASNPIRVLNLLDSDSLNIPIEQLTLQTSTEIGSLEIDKIFSSGQLPSGSSVQFSYRLVSQSGAITNFAPFTGLLPLADSNPYSLGNEYEGTSQNEETLSDKSVSLKLKNLNTSYSSVEIVAVVYKQQNIPEVYLESDINIPQSGNINYTFTGSNSSNIDILELNTRGSQIVSCNDLAVKDNRLIALGLKLREDNLDFDTRALCFRRNVGGQWVSSIINEKSSNSFGTFSYNDIQSDPSNMPSETSDCINPSWMTKKDNIWSLEDEPNLNFSTNDIQTYNPNSGRVGAWGPNVEFNIIEFRTVAYKTDENLSTFVPNNSEDLNPGTAQGSIELHEGEIIDLTGEIANYKSPKISAYLKGYKRGETYRFGIKFFDKYGVPYPVKWISDFRFPDRTNNRDNDNPSVNTLDDFSNRERLTIDTKGNIGLTTTSSWDLETNLSTQGERLMKNFGLEFTIKNLDKIADKISGFTIVRAERTDTDKSVLGEGFVNATLDRGLEGEIIIPISPDDDTIVEMASSYSNLRHCRYIMNFITPEGHNNNPFSYSQGDYLNTTQSQAFLRLSSDDTDGFSLWSSILSGSPIDNERNFEFYNLSDSYFARFDDFGIYDPEVSTSSGVYDLNRTIRNLGTGAATILNVNIASNPSGNLLTYYSTTNKYWLQTDDIDSGLPFLNTSLDRPIHFANYCRDIRDTQYGGDTYSARQNLTKYIDCSSFVSTQDKSSINVKVFRGDTTTHIWDVYWGGMNILQGGTGSQIRCFGNRILCSVESSYNLEFRSEARALYDYNDHRNSQNNLFTGDGRGMDPVNFENVENYNYNSAYAQSNIINESSSKNINSKATNNLPASIWPSEPKILGEVVDSWRTFLPNNLYDLDAIYGPINRAEILNNNLVTIQDEAIAFVPVNERVMVNDETSTALTLGTGDVIGKHRYVSTTSGSKQPFSVVQTDRGIYYFDTRNKKLNRIGQGREPISTLKGMDSYFRNKVSESLIINESDPLNNIGIVAEVNRENDRVYFSLLGVEKTLEGPLLDGETVVFNERSDTFEYLSKHAPKLYISNSSVLITPNINNFSEGYIESKGDYSIYYENFDVDNPYKTEIVFYVNKNAPLSKTFNNLQYNLEGDEQLTRITTSTYDQSTGPLTNVRKRFRIYRHTIGRNEGTKQMIMGPYAKISIEFDNPNFSYFLLHDVLTYFDVYNLNAQ